MKPVEQLSLGWRTHLIFPRFDAIIAERADCLLVRTPHNPTYFWGNFLLFDRPPRVGEAASWLTLFAAEISALQPESSHLAFGIDDSYQDYGAGQFIWRLGDPAVDGYVAASDPRRDGQAAAF